MKTRGETVSSDHLLASLGLAIYEAELVRSFVRTQGIGERLKTGKSASRRMLLLNREIQLLEEKRLRVLGVSGPGREIAEK